MDVKILASQPFLSRLMREIRKPDSLVNPERYAGFKGVFGEENLGFVLAGDVQKEIRIGERAPVYLFGDDFYPYKSKNKGVKCKLFLASAFGIKGFASRKEVEKITDYLEMHRIEGNIGHLINSRKGILSEDKISILELQAQGIKTPKSFHFSDFFKLKNFLDNNSGEYVIKHRFGQQGKQFFRINKKNINKFSELDVVNYLVQEKVNLLNEKRLIFFKDELLGARIIFNRRMPWEEENKTRRGCFIEEKYNPTLGEIEETKRILKLFDSTVGCVDWINVEGKGRYYMEFNGFGTGYGKGPHPYNLNQIVAEKLKENFL